MAQPQPLAAIGLADRLTGILTARGITPTPEDPQPTVDGGGPVVALEAAAARIPPRYRHAHADHPQVAAWVQQITRAAAPGPGGTSRIGRGGSLLIAGPTGTGKTHQAYGAVRSLLAAGVRLRWHASTAADLYAAQRPRSGHDTERDLHALMRCPLLVLDDLGAAKTTEWTEEITYRLINHRYEHLLPTLATTNLTIRDLRAALGDRVTSRLAEMTDRVTLTGTDRRRHPTAA
ncbi:ATP-binding protein [Streptomyces sp. B1866]|uniref:ATP-binding protein n=1 Tax=Streptomyces sp. B1866 TaxID=3075431 RepID=UPI00288D792D|nr:ATP-binding protein [Streptomyces sp. B1866]MDT3397631.1 ATP-binding protein [Streptomyces sp. B1866]